MPIQQRNENTSGGTDTASNTGTDTNAAQTGANDTSGNSTTSPEAAANADTSAPTGDTNAPGPTGAPGEEVRVAEANADRRQQPGGTGPAAAVNAEGRSDEELDAAARLPGAKVPEHISDTTEETKGEIGGPNRENRAGQGGRRRYDPHRAPDDPNKPRHATGTFHFGAKRDYLSDNDRPLVGTRDNVAKVKVGQEFYAAFLHDPAASDDHYRVVNMMDDLKAGRITRNGLTSEYWANWSGIRPPVAVRTENGYKVVG